MLLALYLIRLSLQNRTRLSSCSDSADTLVFGANSPVSAMATPGIPSYAEVQATRRKNASVLASKVLGDPASQPSILNLAEEPAPPKSRRRRFIERLPNTLLVASSAVAVSAALLLCADSIDAALKENQVYVSFILPWMTRSRAAAGWVLLCSIILAIGDALLMWRLARNKDAPPGLLPWVSIALTAAQAVSHHAWQQIPGESAAQGAPRFQQAQQLLSPSQSVVVYLQTLTARRPCLLHVQSPALWPLSCACCACGTRSGGSGGSEARNWR